MMDLRVVKIVLKTKFLLLITIRRSFTCCYVVCEGNKQLFGLLSTVFEHDRVFPSTQKSSRARDAVECSNVFLSAGNNPEVLRNSTEHAEPLFITFRQFL